MPQKVICSECGYILYERHTNELKTPDDIIEMYDNGRCPKCGRKLSFMPVNVEVKPIL